MSTVLTIIAVSLIRLLLIGLLAGLHHAAVRKQMLSPVAAALVEDREVAMQSPAQRIEQLAILLQSHGVPVPPGQKV